MCTYEHVQKGVITTKGIDVSTHQKHIEWQRVASDGVEFAMIKATQGRGEGASTKHLRLFTDSCFKANIAGATDANIPLGVYHYFTAQTATEAREEADYFCDVIDPYRSRIKLWAAVDVESDMYLDKLSKQALTVAVRAFIARVGERGHKPMLYTNPCYLTYRLMDSIRGDMDIWLAQWGVAKPTQVPRLMIWQHGTDTVDGVRGKVDANIGYFAAAPAYKVGGKYAIKAGDVYINGREVPSRLWGKEYTILQVCEGNILLGEINSRVRI